MNNIFKGADPTEAAKKVEIKGKTHTMTVYRIPLDKLYYNEQNGRIATFMSEYNSTHEDINNLNVEEKNMIIEDYIVKSGKNEIQTTKNGIDNFGQREPGYVISDGKVIDGNRRFTCLRQLYRENNNAKDFYFEAVILDMEYLKLENIDIKKLELQIQHGEESKVTYNPIDRLVEIYEYVELDKTFTIKEYSTNCGMDSNKGENLLKRAIAMNEFLEFIDSKGKYFLARDLQLDGPINEIIKFKNKCSETEWEEQNYILFSNILLLVDKDLTRGIRNVIDILNNSSINEDFRAEQEDICREVYQKITDLETVDTSSIRDNIRTSEVQDKAEKVYKNYRDKFDIEKSKNKHKEIVDKLLNWVSFLKEDEIKLLDSGRYDEFLDSFKKLYDIITDLGETFEL